MSKIIAISANSMRKITTPQILKGGLYLTWVATVLTLVTTITGIQGQRHTIQTIGKDSTPSIVIAQRLKDAMAGMDANVANELLVPPGQNQDAVKGYEERFKAASERLVLAAENITFGDLERKPIQTMQLGLGEYISKIQQARDAHVRGDANGSLVAYRAASEIMDKKLLPAADELDQVNLQALEDTYNREKLVANQALLKIFISGAILTTTLIALQLFLSYRTKRNLNPLLLVATGLSIAFLNYTAGSFLSASQQLRTAKEDAFTSMHALRQGRAAAYIANAAESRYLLDKALAAKHEQVFNENVIKIAKSPNGKTFEALVAEVTANTTNNLKIGGFTGFLADELNNITFDGEKAAVLKSLTALGIYISIDQQIRQLEQSGKHQEAIALCIGSKPGQSNWAFDNFKNANTKNFDINQAEFDKAIKQAFQDIEGFEVGASGVLSAIALLVLFGLMPRLKEYFV